MASSVIATAIIVLLCTVMLATSGPADKKTRTKKTKPKKPKIKLRDLVTRLDTLTAQVAHLEERFRKVDGAQGVFSDDPPCPIQKVSDFYLSDVTSSCYRMESTSVMMNWTDAQSFCVSLHPKAHLVAIETEEEQRLLRAKWYNAHGLSTVSRYWTDGSKLDRDDWYWVTGDNLVAASGYQTWIPATTHDDTRFNCLAVYANEGYSWGDVACWVPHVVTCEIEM